MPIFNLVNEDLRLIVSFSPKCASTTLKDWFKNSLPCPQKRTAFDHTKYMIPTAEVDRYDGYAKVFFIRDPFRRLVSFYCRWVVHEPNRYDWADHDKERSLKGKSFSECLAILAEVAGAGHSLEHHLIHQTDDIAGIDYDSVIAVEELYAALLAMSKMFGFDYSPTRRNAMPYDSALTEPVFDAHPKVLAERRIPAHRYFYDAALVALAAKIYHGDIAYYQSRYEDAILFKVPMTKWSAVAAERL